MGTYLNPGKESFEEALDSEIYVDKKEIYEAHTEYIRKHYDGLKESVALLMDGG